ncbi:hypothetical protein A2866_01055 [Candidatus Roizmanbacteria bacterium RIFCSPHIGHO2_01_FULL_39_8]|uniref:Uncharacterized protein n=1 Tax=Candidatus Roizmanbacteria bacterium RIFCSPHIGHO2_01_FULL_39_8 TaxID=1802033 RepID=A0A1F7GM80_9BACT|nr:MAG: hypothetical protein A2866_01055 [Candidatus Roizmanbacteria bacterium RIFCSPHIGHO2_01_FULL_39_8]
MKPIFFSILTGLGFGLSMFFRKLSLKEIGLPAVIFESFANFIVALVLIYFISPFKLNQIVTKSNGVFFAVLGGISLGIGVISFFLATKIGGSVITPSIIGPVVGSITASLLAIFILGESLTLMKLIGIFITFVGLYIFISFK